MFRKGQCAWLWKSITEPVIETFLTLFFLNATDHAYNVDFFEGKEECVDTDFVFHEISWTRSLLDSWICKILLLQQQSISAS